MKTTKSYGKISFNVCAKDISKGLESVLEVLPRAAVRKVLDIEFVALGESVFVATLVAVVSSLIWGTTTTAIVVFLFLIYIS